MTAAQVSAAAAVAAATIALIAAAGTIGTFVTNIRQIRNLQRKQERDEIEYQARLVSCWLVGGEAVVLNASRNAIHHVVVSQVFIQGAAPNLGENVSEDHRRVLAIVPPSQTGIVVIGQPLPGPQGMNTVPGLEVGFRDSAGKSWIRRASGGLERLSGDPDPITYYHVDLPINFAGLRSL